MSTKKLPVDVQKALTDQAKKLLRSPELLPLYLDAVARVGLVGEERNALVVLITGVSRILDKPLNLIVKGRSSSGKNHLVNCCLRLFPDDAVRELTSSSAAAWNYAAGDFEHRIVYLQERNEASGAVHPARLLISEGKLVRIVTGFKNGERILKRYETRGPIASISTTTKNQLEIDDETRHISIWVDESQKQTTRVAIAAAKNSPPLSKKEVITWHEIHRLLETRANARIVLPDWFAKIAAKVYAGDVRVRRYFPAFATACKTVALLRSFQPYPSISLGKDGCIKVSFEDYAISAIIFESVFVQSLHRGDDESLVTRAAVEKIARRTGKGVDAKELAEELSVSLDKTYDLLRSAAERGVIRRANKPQKGNRKMYLPERAPRFLPGPEEIFRDIPAVGDSFDFVHPLTGERLFGRR